MFIRLNVFVLCCLVSKISTEGPIDGMTKREEQALETCVPEISSNVSPNQLIKQLEKEKMLPAEMLKNLSFQQQRGKDATELCRNIFQYLPKWADLDSLVKCLRKSGYTACASRLQWAYIKSGPDKVVTKNDGQPSRHLRQLTANLKQNIHNKPFENRQQFVMTLALASMSQFSQMKTDIALKQRRLAADKTIILLCAGLDANAISFGNNLVNDKMFTLIEELIDQSSNGITSRIAYLGRLATALAIEGNFKESENTLVGARCEAAMITVNYEVITLFYTEVNTRLWKFEHYPSEELKEALLFWGNIGLQSVEIDDEQVAIRWKRNFLIKMSLCHLGLGNRTNVIHLCKVNENDIIKATKLLKEFESLLQGAETRRRMFFHVLKGRLYELREEKGISLRYYKKGLNDAVTGKFEESCFIRDHVVRIDESLKTSPQNVFSKVVALTKRDDEQLHVINLSDPHSLYSFPGTICNKSAQPCCNLPSPNLSPEMENVISNNFVKSSGESLTFHRSLLHEDFSSNRYQVTGRRNENNDDLAQGVFVSDKKNKDANIVLCRRPSPIGRDSAFQPSFCSHLSINSLALPVTCRSGERLLNDRSVCESQTVLKRSSRSIGKHLCDTQQTFPKLYTCSDEGIDRSELEETFPKHYLSGCICVAPRDVRQANISTRIETVLPGDLVDINDIKRYLGERGEPSGASFR